MRKIRDNIPPLTIFFGMIALVISVVSAYTTEAVGANIGAGILSLLGLVLILIGLTWLGFTKKGWKRIVILSSVLLLIAALSYAWLMKESELNRLYCKEKIEKQETIPEGLEFCEKYL